MNYEVSILENGDRLFTHKITRESFVQSKEFIERYNLIHENKDLGIFTTEEKNQFLKFMRKLLEIKELKN